MRIEGQFPHVGRATKGGSLPNGSSNGNGKKPSRVGNDFSVTHTPAVPAWKSALDMACILFLLPIWLPLMILLVLVTRLASPGPIFYRQERVGLGGRHFSIWKFRTMKVATETRTHEHYFYELMKVDCPMTKLDAYGDPRLGARGRSRPAVGPLGRGAVRHLGVDQRPDPDGHPWSNREGDHRRPERPDRGGGGFGRGPF